jgi:hypothetical protein
MNGNIGKSQSKHTLTNQGPAMKSIANSPQVLFVLFVILAFTLTGRSQPVIQVDSAGNKLVPNVSDSVNYKCLPFTETWDQGTFTYQDWTFSSSDNNWVIDTAYGNPAPCADFFWQPHRINYSQTMTSDTLDATAWTCANVWFDFDLKVIAFNNTGNEKMRVEIFRNGSWQPCVEVANTGTTGWVPYHIKINSVKGQLFQVRFVVYGINSADVLHWYLDNIHIYGNCISPKNFFAQCLPMRKIYLGWQQPECTPSTITTYVFDDGNWENGCVSPANSVGWFGNEFPVGIGASGLIQHVKLYFVDNGTGSSQPLSIDIFDSTKTMIGSSAAFAASPVNTWIDIPISNVPFSGKFYVMVKFNNLPAQAYYLASDENGPYANQDLGWNISSTGVWAKVSTLGYGGPCVFLCRVEALVYDDQNLMPDSSILLGYNVYRSGPSGTLPFTKCNTNPITTISYIDSLPANSPVWIPWDYFTTALHLNMADSTILCEASTDTIVVYYVGLNDREPMHIIVWPNPATEKVKITSDVPISSIEVYNIMGSQVFLASQVIEGTLDVDMRPYGRGVFYFKVTTRAGTRTEKVVVTD